MPLLDEICVGHESWHGQLYVADAIELAAGLFLKAAQSGAVLREAVGARLARWSGQTGRFHGGLCDPRLDSSGLLWYDATQVLTKQETSVMENTRIRFVALGFMGTVLVAVIAVVTGCLGTRPGSDARGTQTRDYDGNHADETLLKTMAEAEEASQMRPTPEAGGGDAGDCVSCHTDEKCLKAMAEAEETPPTDTCDG